MRAPRGLRLMLALWGMTGLAAFAGCDSGTTARPPMPTATATASPTATLEPRPSPVASLGAPPADCAAAPPPQTMTLPSDFGGGFIGPLSVDGGSPVWELGLGSDGVLHLGDASGGPYPSTKVMWLVGPNYAGQVTLSGRELRAGTPLWFEIYPNNYAPEGPSVFTTHAVLDPNAPNRGGTDNATGHWNIWGIGVDVLAAGCYQLDVSWAGGGWHMTFAAGS